MFNSPAFLRKRSSSFTEEDELKQYNQQISGVPAEESQIFGMEQQYTKLNNLSYVEFSSMVKSLGYANIQQMTNSQLEAIGEELEGNIDLTDKNSLLQSVYCQGYTDETSNLINGHGLLQLGFMLSNHTTQQKQAKALWRLINPQLKKAISSNSLLEATKGFVYIAVDLAIRLFEASTKLMSDLEHTMSSQQSNTLAYLQEACRNKDMWIQEYSNSLPQEIDEKEFMSLIKRDCFSTSNLRMAITRRTYSKSGRKVMNSSSVTIILEYLERDKIINMQQCCKKLYTSHVPRVINEVSIWARPSVVDADKYNIIWDGYIGQRAQDGCSTNSQVFSLGSSRENVKELRQPQGPSTFVSIFKDSINQDNSQLPQARSWQVIKVPNSKNNVSIRIHENKKSKQFNKLLQAGALSAHRTFMSDVRDKKSTFVQITIEHNHQGVWKLQRVGDYNENRFIVKYDCNKCVCDRVNQINWELGIPVNSSPKDFIKDAQDYAVLEQQPTQTSVWKFEPIYM